MNNGQIGRSSLILASGTIVSRVLGFISAVVLAQTLGTVGAGADTFALANQLPNNVYAIVAGGILSAVLVPQIVRANMHDDGGARYINKLLTLGFSVFGVVTVLATLAAPALVALYAGQSSHGGFTGNDLALATAFAWWCLPQVLFYAVYSLLGEVLNARGVFGPFTWAPALNNVVAIGGMMALGVVFMGDVTDSTAWTPLAISVLAGSATFGVAAQAAILFVFLRRAGVNYRPDFAFRGVGLGHASRLAGWTFGMIILTQIAGIVQTNVASIAAGSGEPSLAVLRFSWLIFMLPHSVATVSLATAYFTRMSADVRDNRLDSLIGDIRESLSRIGLFMVVASVAILVLALPMAAIFGGTFLHIQGMAFVLAGFALGLVPFSIVFVLQRVFYALEDTRTPFVIQAVHSGLFIVGALLLTVAEPSRIAVGIALLTSVVGTVQAVLLILVLRRRLGRLGGTEMVTAFGRFVLATIPAVATGLVAVFALGGYSASGWGMQSMSATLIVLVVSGLVMMAAYVGGLLVVRDPHIRVMLAGLRRR